MTYDTQIIYGDTKSNKNNFRLNEYRYYKTKTGKPKKMVKSGKSFNITNEEYDLAWQKYVEIFG